MGKAATRWDASRRAVAPLPFRPRAGRRPGLLLGRSPHSSVPRNPHPHVRSAPAARREPRKVRAGPPARLPATLRARALSRPRARFGALSRETRGVFSRPSPERCAARLGHTISVESAVAPPPRRPTSPSFANPRPRRRVMHDHRCSRRARNAGTRRMSARNPYDFVSAVASGRRAALADRAHLHPPSSSSEQPASQPVSHAANATTSFSFVVGARVSVFLYLGTVPYRHVDPVSSAPPGRVFVFRSTPRSFVLPRLFLGSDRLVG